MLIRSMIRDVHDGNPVSRREWVDSRRGPGSSLGVCPAEQPRTHACRRREIERPIETGCAQEPIEYSKYLNRQNREAPLPVDQFRCDDSPRHMRPEVSPECRSPDSHAGHRPEMNRRPDVPRLGDRAPVESVRVERRLITVYRIVLQSRPGRMIDIFA